MSIRPGSTLILGVHDRGSAAPHLGRGPTARSAPRRSTPPRPGWAGLRSHRYLAAHQGHVAGARRRARTRGQRQAERGGKGSRDRLRHGATIAQGGAVFRVLYSRMDAEGGEVSSPASRASSGAAAPRLLQLSRPALPLSGEGTLPGAGPKARYARARHPHTRGRLGVSSGITRDDSAGPRGGAGAGGSCRRPSICRRLDLASRGTSASASRGGTRNVLRCWATPRLERLHYVSTPTSRPRHGFSGKATSTWASRSRTTTRRRVPGGWTWSERLPAPSIGRASCGGLAHGETAKFDGPIRHVGMERLRAGCSTHRLRSQRVDLAPSTS